MEVKTMLAEAVVNAMIHGYENTIGTISVSVAYDDTCIYMKVEEMCIRDRNNEEDFMRFARKMRKMGIDEALRNAGCQDGDIVCICDIEFEFID